MAYFGGGTPRHRGDRRRRQSRAPDLRLLLAGVVAGVVGVFALAGNAPRAFAPVGIALVLVSLVPGRAGGLAALSACGASAALLVMAPSVSGIVVAGLLAGSALLARTAATSFPDVELLAAVMSPDRLARESVLLDERAHTELTRARRYGRPLSVVSIVVAPTGGHASRGATEAGRLLSRELRITDVVGVTEHGEAVAILPDTGPDVVSALVGRLSESARSAAITGTIGYATFPDDAVTWRELRYAAHGRDVPLTDADADASPSQLLDHPLLEGQRVAG